MSFISKILVNKCRAEFNLTHWKIHTNFLTCNPSQSRNTILDGTLPCTKDEAIQLAALQCYIQYGKYDGSNLAPGCLTLTDFIPKQYTSVRDIESLMYKEYRMLWDIDELEAKYRYIQLCSSLPTFGTTLFLVQERRAGKKDTSCLLGVGRDNIVRLDVKRKNILSTWPLSTIRRWIYYTDSFSLVMYLICLMLSITQLSNLTGLWAVLKEYVHSQD